MRRFRWFLGAVVGAVAFPAVAAEWRMDPAGSQLRFEASYQGQAAPGTFKAFDTQLRFDPARPTEARLRVTVDVTSVDMGSADINDAIREPDWFDLKRHPKAEFISKTISQTAQGRYAAQGTLRLKGAEREVTVPFTWEGGGRAATMKGDLTLDRVAFNIGTGEWSSDGIIGLDVKVLFNVRLQRAD